MSDTFTTFLKEAEPKDREQSIESYFKSRLQSLDRAAAGYTDVSLAGLSGNVDLTPTQAKHRRILLTGNPSAAVTVRVPHATGANCDIIFANACGGSFAAVTFKSTGPNAGNPAGVPLAANYTRTVAHNGESVYPVTGEILSLVSTLNSGIVAFWKLDEASGTRSDSVGSSNLTDNNTVTQAAGKIGNAAQLTRANSESLSVADNAALSVGDIDFSVSAWVYLDSKPGSMGIVSRWTTPSPAEYLLYYNSGDDRYHFAVNGSGTGDLAANAFGSPGLGAWHFIVCWHDSAADTINICVNNGAVNSTAYAGGSADTAAAFRLGEYNGSNYFNGRLDGVGFWKRVLTAAERTELYNAGAGREYPF